MQAQFTTLPPRFWSKVQAQADGCWLWTAALTTGGYGHFYYWRRHAGAHRLAYEDLVSPIPDGKEIDHLCRVRHCVNPLHMEPVTRRTNLLRGQCIPSRNAAKTHCPRGHPYGFLNTYVERKRNGHFRARRCRICWGRPLRQKAQGLFSGVSR